MIIRIALTAILFLLFLQTGKLHGNKAWQLKIVETPVENQGVKLVKLETVHGDDRTRIQLILFNTREHDIAIIDNPGGQQRGMVEALNEEDMIAGVNGGYFHPDYQALGLVISNGELIHPQENATLLSGILAANEKKFFLLRPGEFKRGPRTRYALQAGPFLLDNGRIVPGLDNSKRARRTVIIQDNNGNWALAAIGPLTLADTASLLSDKAFRKWINSVRALNLDGGSSSAMWFEHPDGGTDFYLRSLTRVRNYLGVRTRSSTD